jgi:hypothetical protein
VALRGISRVDLVAFVVAYCAFGWLFPSMLIVLSDRAWVELPWLLLVILELASARLAWLSTVRTAYSNLMDVAFWVFVFFFGIAATLQRMAGVFPWSPSGITAADLLLADLVLVVGVVAYAVGQLVAPRRALREILVTTGYRRLLLAAVVVACAWPVVYIGLFGVDAILVDRTSRGALFAPRAPAS